MGGFRPNVAALVLNRSGQVLVCERLHFAGAWQFPQGGVDKGEDPEQALRRELVEEIGLQPTSYRIGRRRGGYRYIFPEGLKTRRRWKNRGQEQTYFECLLKQDEVSIHLDTETPEFRAYRWIEPGEFRLDWLPDFKREVYRQVMRDFFDLELE